MPSARRDGSALKFFGPASMCKMPLDPCPWPEAETRPKLLLEDPILVTSRVGNYIAGRILINRRPVKLRYYTVPLLTLALGGVLLGGAMILDSFACTTSDQAAAMQGLLLCGTQQAQVTTFAIAGAILAIIGAAVLVRWIRKYGRRYVDPSVRCPECGTSRGPSDSACRRCGFVFSSFTPAEKFKT